MGKGGWEEDCRVIFLEVGEVSLIYFFQIQVLVFQQTHSSITMGSKGLLL